MLRKRVILVYVTEEEHRLLRLASAKADMSLSAYLRTTALKANSQMKLEERFAIGDTR